VVDKSAITPELVARLLAAQFPEWRALPVTCVELDGWDNTTFRLGSDMSVRLPSGDGYAVQVDKEHRWLPVLAPQLPLPIPQPLAKGTPSPEFPRPWSVYRWLEGEVATLERIADLERFAADLGAFLRALYRADAGDGPRPGAQSSFRGGPLATWDEQTRGATAALGSTALGSAIDGDAVIAAWDCALNAPFDGPAVWVHGDVVASNLLVTDGELSAVIDFGCSAVGDPACDLAIAWTLFSGSSRRVFRDALDVDDAAWERGRGWALWKALIEIRHGRAFDADAASPGWQRMGWRTNAEGIIDELLAG
jgi:aminoglycoside phosphotransferase (APT) family kinase protein